MSIKQKVFTSVVAILVAVLASAWFGMLGTNHIVDSATYIEYKAFPSMNQADHLNSLVLETKASIISGYEELDEEMLDHLLVLKGQFADSVKEMAKLSDDEQLKAIRRDYNMYVDNGIVVIRKIIKTEDVLLASEEIVQIASVALQLMGAIESYKESKREVFKNNLDSIRVNSESMKFIHTSVSIIALVIIFVMAILGAKILDALRALAESSRKLSSGEMDEVITITRRDEIGVLQKSFEDMRVSLKEHIQRLETTNEELTQFSYRTSHDIKAPLVTIRGFLYLLEKEMNNGNVEGVTNYCKRMNKNIFKLETLISEILALSRSSFEEEPIVDLNFVDLIKSINENLEVMFRESRVELICELNYKKSFHSHSNKVVQVLENLISNSLKYYKEDITDRKVWISTWEEKDGLGLSIRDNGIGIPEKYQEGVFGMFFRASPDRAFGSGLGLYLVKKNVEKLKGEISFESSSEGTAFRLYLPNLVEDSGDNSPDSHS